MVDFHSSGYDRTPYTVQPGCGLRRAVLPYLLLAASLELSHKDCVLRLRPVVANPNWLFSVILGLLNTYFEIWLKRLACRLSDLSLGM